MSNDSNAYWITPDMVFLSVGFTHIDVVIKNPKTFGITSNYIQSIYSKHNEPLGHEGYAREEIMVSLIKKHWVRLRYYAREDKWIIQIQNIHNEKTRIQISEFLQGGLDKQIKKINNFSTIIILNLDGEIVNTFDGIKKAREYFNENVGKIITFKDLFINNS